jgi:ferric-dicitrate binding protein FerR (iron transport regulator)
MSSEESKEPGLQQAVERLLELAGPPPAVPGDFYDEVRGTARVAWQAKVEERRAVRRRRRGVYLLAASVVLVLGAGLYLRLAFSEAASTSVQAAVVEAWSGIPTPGFPVGGVVEAGSEIATGGASHVALRLVGGASLRLDRGTRLVLESSGVMWLKHGAVYLDTGVEGSAAVEVRTPYGVATDVGTQFEVRLGEEGLRLRVREGEVRLALADDTELVAQAGVGLTVLGDGTVEREAVAAHGGAWEWVLRAAPSFELEGKSVAEALDWIVRETGWELRLADAELHREVRAAVVHGSLQGVPPDEAPELVLLGSRLAYRIEGGTLFVERREE